MVPVPLGRCAAWLGWESIYSVWPVYMQMREGTEAVQKVCIKVEECRELRRRFIRADFSGQRGYNALAEFPMSLAILNDASGGESMAVVWGPKAGGKKGAMTEEEIIAHLFNLSPWRTQDRTVAKAFQKAANYMLNHNGQGGGTVHHFDGKMIHHTTENRGEATVFFTNKDGGVVSIVGIGEHSGTNAATATYTLVWKSMSWKPTKMLANQLVPTKQISL